MMEKEPYNWWTDPKNKKEVDRLSWWEHPENQKNIEIPLAITKTEDGWWIVAPNDKTNKLLGESLTSASQGRTQDEAIQNFFLMIRLSHDFETEQRRNFQRFVPFRKGDWKHTGGTWFVVFGYHFYFRTGKNMKGGWYIPFTNLNISITSEWKTYRKWKQKRENIN